MTSGILSLLAPAPPASPAPPPQDTESVRLRQFFEEHWASRLRDSPELATYRGSPNAGWSDLSPASTAGVYEAARQKLAAFSAIDRSRLTASEQVDYDLFRRRLERTLEGQRFDDIGSVLLIDHMTPTASSHRPGARGPARVAPVGRLPRLRRGLGALRRGPGSRARHLRRTSAGSATRWGAPCAWWSTPACTPGAGRASGDRPLPRPHRLQRARDRKRGGLHQRELRAYAQKELGPRFDLRAFHDRLLGRGQLPLDFREKRIEDWGREQQAR